MKEPTHPEESDSGLVRRLQKGDSGAFDALFDRYRRRLLAYVRGLTGSRDLAEDIVQDCFVQLVRRVEGIDPERSVRGWLFRVARNRSIDALRRRKFEVVTDGEDVRGVEAPESPETPLERMTGDELRGDLRRAVARLPEKERDVVVMHFYGELTFQEIAGVLRRPLGTVLWQSQRVLAKLRECLRSGGHIEEGRK